ncbi:hypothetical protein AGMMS50230_20750 [Spirochaetia bacterium]|nr:hypothetical protein AGMMS50230_20750 [Spirochaetia bacterium]
MTIGAVADHRSREGGAIIYPVYSRRSAGLSIGVNLFPDTKICSFDCPYCEVFPFKTDLGFSLKTMKAALRSAMLEAMEQNIPIRDICFSGNGEPTMSVHFAEALEAAKNIRSELYLEHRGSLQLAETKIVLITNGTGLLDPLMFDLLKNAANNGLYLWLKLDAATEDWYKTMDKSDIAHETLLSRIGEFAASGAPFTIQTMVCMVKGQLPPEKEKTAWVRLVTELAAASAAAHGARGGIRAVQIYGKARPAPEDPLAEAAPAAILEERAEQLRAALAEAALSVPVEVYQ